MADNENKFSAEYVDPADAANGINSGRKLKMSDAMFADDMNKIINNTMFVKATKADIESPTLTGIPKSPSPAAETKTDQIATTEFVHNAIDADRPYATVNPVMNGTVNKGSSNQIARADHVHPIDTTREPVIEKNTAFNKDFETVAANIKMNGTANAGISNKVAKADHVHPTDTSRVAKNNDIIAGTKCKITYDAKGLVTAGTDLSASDIPNLDSSKITSGALPIVRGGTGADNAATARSNLGITPGNIGAATAEQGRRADNAEPKFNKNSAFNKSFGTEKGTVCEGNDTRLSNARPANDVYDWAKAAAKPSYGVSEIAGAQPTLVSGSNIKTINAKSILGSGNLTLSEIGAANVNHSHNFDDLVGSEGHTHTKSQISDFPTSMPASDVYAWAKDANKPPYTASEVGAAAIYNGSTLVTNVKFDFSNGTLNITTS